MDIHRLRRETEIDHQAVEAALPLMHQGLDTAEYIQYLQQMYGLVAAWEERAAEVAPQWMQATLAARQRKHLLERDLAWFGLADPDNRRPALPDIFDLSSLFGTMYVMEGSTLGGQLIARHVETTLHLREGQGDAYFRGHGDRTGLMWKEFCEMLTRHLPDSQTEAVVASAKAMFATFGEWMQQKSVIHGC